ncbi:MAG TPA: Flp pilus assembly protein CpaB [Stellaceae bacterium]|nr:Flp pilus assembly protein CpaB [Stellaceae bacterium]
MNAKVILSFLFLLSLGVVGFLFYNNMPKPQLQAAAAQTVQAPKIEVLAATAALPPGTLLRGQDVAWTTVSKAMAGMIIRPAAATLAVRPEADEDARAQVYGAALRVALTAGEPITPQTIVKPGDRDFLALVLSPGTRAIAIPLSASGASSGLLSPGDRVDVLLTQSFKSDETPLTHRSVSETVVENLRVLAVDPEKTQNRSVTLEVMPEQAEKINVATELGKLSLTLRPVSIPTAMNQQPAATTADAGVQPTWSVDASPALRSVLPPEKQAEAAAPIVKVMRGTQSQDSKAQ